MQFSALNEGTASRLDRYSIQQTSGAAKPFSLEAEESEALKLHQRAIAAHHSGDVGEAEQLYNQLLQTRFVSSAPESVEEENVHLGKECQLKYVAYKNLASLATERADHKTALDYYIKALQLDSSDVHLWYHTGIAGTEYGNLVLARHAFNQGLSRNQLHWLCLDKLCTVLYTLGDDSSCLEMSVKGLQRDAGFITGLVFVHKLYEESLYLLQWKKNPKKYMQWLSLSVDPADIEEINEKVKHLERNRDRLVEEQQQTVEQLKLKLQQPTWENFGCSVLELYDRVSKCEGQLWFSEQVDTSQAIPAQQLELCSSPLTPSSINLSMLRVSPLVLSQASDGEASDQGRKVAKRKMPPLIDEFELAPKRRSTRVKSNMRKKEEETVNYSERLQRFVPPRLKPPNHLDEAASPRHPSLIAARLDAASGSNISGISIHWNEMAKVQEFVLKCKYNSGIIDILYRFAAELGDPKRSKTKWSVTLVKVFLRVYVALRKHIKLPVTSRDEPDQEAVEKAHFVLCACELQLDSHKGSKPHDSDSECLLRDYHIGTSTTFGADVDFLVAMTTAKLAFGPAWQNFAIRVYWLRARFSVLIGQTIMAINSFCVCADLLSMERPVDAALSMLPRQPLTIQLPNCIEDSVISEERVKEKLEFIDRCQSLDEVRVLYNAGEYENVVEILTSSLSLVDMFNPTIKSLYGTDDQESSQNRPSPERPAQLLILEDALLKVGREKDALLCAENNLHEVACRLSPQIFSKTAEMLKELISNIDRAVASTDLMNKVPEFVLARMLQSIIKVIDCYMDTAESVAEFFPVTLPWIIAVRLVQFGELSDLPADFISTTSQSTVGPSTAAYPGKLPLLSVLLLRDSHEKLGRHSVCCENDGRFLELALDSLLTCLQDNSDEELIRDIEQCFLCLYGHPNKKAKTKKLQDHGSLQIDLTWEKASTVFSFFCPERQRPCFDGKKSYVTTELENLLRRITALIPATEVPAVSSKSLLSYLDGNCDEMTSFTADTTDSGASKHPIVLEIFYLLADFYRRNGESIKAMKFYLQDLSYSPQRFDSWAGMAEARARKIADKLNALDRKIELCKVVERESGPSLRSFEMAVNINQTNCTLLEHYGLFCYTLHSFAAQQIKQLHDDFPSLPWLSQLRPEMLTKAGQLFEQCIECSDANTNSYVHYLMLGKVAEKSGQSYDVLLDKYMKALNWLDKKQAHPRRIDYHNPLEYSIETLAVYHHLHTAVLKILQDVQLEYLNLVKFDSLEKYVAMAAKCSFAQTDTHSPMKGASRWLGDASLRGDFSPRSLLEHRRLVLEEHCYAKSLVDINQECGANSVIAADSLEDECGLGGSEEESQERKLGEEVESKFKCAMKEISDMPLHLVSEANTDVPCQTEEEKGYGSTPSEAAVSQEETSQSSHSTEESQGRKLREEVESKFEHAMKEISDMPLHLVSEANPDVPCQTEEEKGCGSTPSEAAVSQEEASQGSHSGEETDVREMPLLEGHDLDGAEHSAFEPAEDPIPGLLPVDDAMEDISSNIMNDGNVNESGIPPTLTDKRKTVDEADSIERDKSTKEVSALPSQESVESTAEDEREKSSSPILSISPLPLIEDLCGLPHGLENMDLDLQTPSPEQEDAEVDHTEEETHATGEIQKSPIDITAVPLAPPIERYMTLVSKCLDAMQLCACRYPEHYKSRYRLAYAYSHIPTHLNLEMARDILWGSPSQEGKQHLQPLFSRKGTNFFQIWKMRIDELERPGSFIAYATKCVCLLIEVLGKLEDRQSLLTVIHMLLKKADLSKRYIPENEKKVLIKKAMKAHVDITQEKVAQLRLSGDGGERGKKLTKDVCLNVLELLSDTYQAKVLCTKSDCDTLEIDIELGRLFGLLAPRLEEVWRTVSSCPHEARDQFLTDEAIRFCHQRFPSKQLTESTAPVGVPSQFRSAVDALFPSDST